MTQAPSLQFGIMDREPLAIGCQMLQDSTTPYSGVILAMVEQVRTTILYVEETGEMLLA